MGHVDRFVRVPDSGQTEIADLENAVAVHQQVTWLDVPVEDVGRVQVAQTYNMSLQTLILYILQNCNIV